MFISVGFGYRQRKIFNINCQTAPLIDAINQSCFEEMGKMLKKKEDAFHKEMAVWRKKEGSL